MTTATTAEKTIGFKLPKTQVVLYRVEGDKVEYQSRDRDVISYMSVLGMQVIREMVNNYEELLPTELSETVFVPDKVRSELLESSSDKKKKIEAMFPLLSVEKVHRMVSKLVTEIQPSNGNGARKLELMFDIKSTEAVFSENNIYVAERYYELDKNSEITRKDYLPLFFAIWGLKENILRLNNNLPPSNYKRLLNTYLANAVDNQKDCKEKGANALAEVCQEVIDTIRGLLGASTKNGAREIISKARPRLAETLASESSSNKRARSKKGKEKETVSSTTIEEPSPMDSADDDEDEDLDQFAHAVSSSSSLPIAELPASTTTATAVKPQKSTTTTTTAQKKRARLKNPSDEEDD